MHQGHALLTPCPAKNQQGSEWRIARGLVSCPARFEEADGQSLCPLDAGLASALQNRRRQASLSAALGSDASGAPGFRRASTTLIHSFFSLRPPPSEQQQQTLGSLGGRVRSFGLLLLTARDSSSSTSFSSSSSSQPSSDLPPLCSSRTAFIIQNLSHSQPAMSQPGNFLFTSESVGEGHPDKIWCACSPPPTLRKANSSSSPTATRSQMPSSTPA